MNAAPAFTILAPVNRPPDLLPFAIRSVLAQTRPDFEIFIICDGAPAATVEAARAFEAQDRRIRSFIHPKGQRHGEAYRHLALQEARGQIVCQIGDDDLWFPEHLDEAERLLASADFGCSLPLFIDADGAPRLHFADFGDPVMQSQMAKGQGNMFGPTVSAYRLETYRSLPQGWSPAPEGAWTDLFMWQKFLARPGTRCATRFVVTAVTFPQGLRREWTLQRRREEIAVMAARIEDPAFRDQLFRDALAAAARRASADLLRLAGARAVGRTLLGAVEEADAALTGIAAAGDAATQARLAQAALSRLPDRAWLRQLQSPASSPTKQ